MPSKTIRNIKRARRQHGSGGKLCGISSNKPNSNIEKYVEYASNNDLDGIDKLSKQNPNVVNEVLDYAMCRNDNNTLNNIHKNGKLDITKLKSLFIEYIDQDVNEVLKEIIDIIGINDPIDNQPLIFIATINNNIDIVSYLISKGFKIDKKNPRGDTLLCVALENNYMGIAKLLILNGADVNMNNSENKTPLELAIRQNNKDIAEILIKKGANINIGIHDSFNNSFNNNNKIADTPLMYIEKKFGKETEIYHYFENLYTPVTANVTVSDIEPPKIMTHAVLSNSLLSYDNTPSTTVFEKVKKAGNSKTKKNRLKRRQRTYKK